MSIATLLRYLVGRRQAILDAAATLSALWLGFLFVLSAGFAREYDGEDLLHEPWHLAIPLGASLVTSLLLFCLLWMASRNRGPFNTSFLRGYRTFLALYWLTAPLAWLYAVPVERFLSAADATAVNLSLLGLVAAWRVLLIIRVVCVVFEARPWQATFLVLLFADTVMLALLHLTPLPVFSVMGGIRLSESEELILGITFLAGFIGVVTWPVWMIGADIVLFKRLLSRAGVAFPFAQGRVANTAWLLAAASLLVWIGILPFTQSEQQLRRVVEHDLKNGRIAQALATMSRHDRDDFPPHWDPPPRVGYGESIPPLLDVIESVLSSNAPLWVAELFEAKLRQSLGDDFGRYWDGMDGEHLDRLLSIVERLQDKQAFVEANRSGLEMQLDELSRRSEEQKARIRALLEEADLRNYQPAGQLSGVEGQ